MKYKPLHIIAFAELNARFAIATEVSCYYTLVHVLLATTHFDGERNEFPSPRYHAVNQEPILRDIILYSPEVKT